MQNYFIYILTNRTKKILYLGMTDDLERRQIEHRNGVFPGFTKRYGVADLVYYEILHGLEKAITREKQLKGWRRDKKVALIEKKNPSWEVFVFKNRKDINFLDSLNYNAPSEIDPSTSLGIKHK